jgi:two-component system response regulator NreC
MRKIRILVLDHHTMVRACLRIFINAQPDMEVVEEAEDHRAALAKARELKPDVIITEINMPKTGGMNAIEQLLQEYPQARVVVLTLHDDLAHVRTALAAGSSGYVTKRAPTSELLDAIRAVYEGHTFVDSTVSSPLVRDLIGNSMRRHAAGPGTSRSPLSRRERQVLIGLAQGFTNRQIAEQLHVGVKSVETYRARIAQKLDLHTRADLVRYAHESGLFTPEAFLERRDDAALN